MILGLGNDIIEISRIEKSISRYGKKFLDRIFTQEEQDYCDKHKNSLEHYAGRFAAKEAIVKALGTGIRQGSNWTDINISNDENGKPVVYLSPELRSKYGDPQILVSISHGRDYATAVAIIG